MSAKVRPHYADPKGVIMETFIPNVAAFASGATVPVDGTPGYASGCLFIKTAGVAGANLYKNDGSVTSCEFKAFASLL